MEYRRVHFLADPEPYREQEELYWKVRQKEGRILEDDAVLQLPYVPPTSPYAHEWRWRRRSLGRLKKRIGRYSGGKLHILDLGCGNGWMANRLAENARWNVTAMDLNRTELEQGARLFGRSNLQFYYADISSMAVAESGLPADVFRQKFEIILLAASVQYFPDLPALLATLRRLLQPNGEIHLIDSHFYPSEVARSAARQRTLDYYTQAGVPEMAAYYHHHLWQTVQQSGGENLNNRPWIRLGQKIGWYAPFPWIRIRQ